MFDSDVPMTRTHPPYSLPNNKHAEYCNENEPCTSVQVQYHLITPRDNHNDDDDIGHTFALLRLLESARPIVHLLGLGLDWMLSVKILYRMDGSKFAGC